ncbi:hypothetical protein [Tengunoibacter tsumagoiensis]|uniref:hypothetical protein n=1 Tax=Tengunoibacter tsumagoiensis TaxID=2014871 RepID=UPI000F820CD3|nr:hypothetical protein [Tengunoibacter tsumagoiensis]
MSTSEPAIGHEMESCDECAKAYSLPRLLYVSWEEVSGLGAKVCTTEYGTLLVDLERHLSIDLLSDATSESFATWLQAHPSVELISCDRGTTFADGANRGPRWRFRLQTAGTFCTIWMSR